jgi:hypothetical protein
VTPVFIPAVWKFIVPPRVHFFLWLTRDNLGTRRKAEDSSCIFCSEESIHHLFFDCVVAKKAWELVPHVTGVRIGVNFESLAGFWLCNKKFGVTNMISSAVCWSLWKLRNCLCFQGVDWVSMRML